MDNLRSSHLTLSRRGFLKLLAAAGITAAGGYLLSEYTPWLNYTQEANRSWMPLEISTEKEVKMRELVRFATLAASSHNSQPWKFAILDDAIEIRPDHARRLPVVDPHDRELWISLGCALENLVVAAQATGFHAEVTYQEATDAICVRLAADFPRNSPLFQAIPHRQNTRSEYNGQTIVVADFDQLQATALEPGVGLRFAANPNDLETVTEYVRQGNLVQYADQAFVGELIEWLRFNKKEAINAMDGLYSRCTGNPEAPRWMGRLFLSNMKPQQQADADAKKLRSSPGAFVISSDSDDKAAWVRTGQVYERLALTMTALSIKSALLNQPIEVAGLRGEFQNALGLGNAFPQLLVRFGYAESMPRSLRRPVEKVILDQ